MNVAPTAFALAPPRNGKVVDVATTAVSTTMRSSPVTLSLMIFEGKNKEEGTYQMVTVRFLYRGLWQWQWHC